MYSTTPTLVIVHLSVCFNNAPQIMPFTMQWFWYTARCIVASVKVIPPKGGDKNLVDQPGFDSELNWYTASTAL